MRPGVYAGTREDCKMLAHPGLISHVPPVVAYPFILVIDLPGSAVIDTVMLPVDLTRHNTDDSSSSANGGHNAAEGL